MWGKSRTGSDGARGVASSGRGWPVEGWWVLRAVPVPVSPALPSVQPGLPQHPACELVEETGGAAQAQLRGGPQRASRARPARRSAAARQPGWALGCGGRGCRRPPRPRSPDGSPRPTVGAAGWRRPRCGPGVAEAVVVAAGEVGVAGGQHLVVGQRTPDRPPGRDPQPWPAPPRDGGLASVGARGVVAWAQPGVLDQRPGGVEADRGRRPRPRSRRPRPRSGRGWR